MDTYTISKAYHWTNDKEIEITSENLYYAELCNGSGCQCNSLKNGEEIRLCCNKIADLIREIETLNQNE